LHGPQQVVPPRDDRAENRVQVARAIALDDGSVFEQIAAWRSERS